MSIEINRIKNNPLSSSSDLPNDKQRTNVWFKSNPIPQDKVEISSKKKGLSDGAKIGIGIGTLTLIGVGIYKRKSLKKFWEKIIGKGGKKPPEKPNKPSEPKEAPNKPKREENTPFSDIKDFGTKLADGTIRFKTEQGAIDYARKTICEALQGPTDKQIEVAVAVKGTDILGIVKGGATSVDIKGLKGLKELTTTQERLNTTRDIIILHGHPDEFGKGITLPLSCSPGDIYMLRGHNIKAYVAYNSKGEFNKVEIFDIEKFAKPSLTEFKLSKAEDKYNREKVLSEQENKRYLELEKLFDEYRQKKTKYPDNLKKEYDLLETKFRKLENEYMKTEEYAKTLHKMYTNEAEASGLIYSTNFSNL